MSSGKPVTDSEAKQFVEMFKEKSSIRAIAKKFARSTSTVKARLILQGAIKQEDPAAPAPVVDNPGEPPDEPVLAPAAQKVIEPSALRPEFDRMLERLGLAAEMEQETGRAQVHLGLCNSPHCVPCAQVRKAVLAQTAQTIRKGTLQELAAAAEWAGEVDAADRVYLAFTRWEAAGRPDPEDEHSAAAPDAETVVTITP